MNIQQIKIFHTLVQNQSLTRTAEELAIKQPTVSFHMKNLEKELGVTLYEKKTTVFRLTPAGKMFARYAKEITSLIHEAERVMADYQLHKRGELLLGASHIPANYILPPVLSLFTEAHPNIHLSLTVQTAPETIQMVKERKVDFGVVSEQQMKDDMLAIHRIKQDELVLVLPPAHPLGREKLLNIEDLRGEQFILHKQGSTREMIDRWSNQNGFIPRIKMELSSIEAICTMVKMNSGISILSNRAINPYVRQEELITRPVPHMENNRYISIIYRKDRPVSPVMKEFMNLIWE